MSGRINAILNAKYQFLAALVVLTFFINCGLTTGWPSPSILLLTSDESPLPTGKITIDEASWITSILSIGALIGICFYGFVINHYGRKWPMIFLAVPMICSWLLIAFAQNVNYLYVARFIEGNAAGGYVITVPVYLVEIASDDVRGMLSSVVPIGSATGILIAYTLGNYFNYYVTPIFAIVSIAIFAVVFLFFPESPVFLVRQNRITEAEKSLRFYRGIPINDEKFILSEIEKLKNIVGASKCQQNDGKHLQWSDFTTKSAKRAMIIATVLFLLNQFCGVSAMINYSASIFEASGSALSPNTSAMIVGAVKVFGTLVGAPLIDIAGRRFLYITSSIGTAAAQIVLGVYMMLSYHEYDVEAYNWIPIVAYSFVLFLLALAVSSIGMTVTAEVMPDKIKDFGLAYAGVLNMLSTFIVVKSLPTVSALIGWHGCMFIFATICLFGAIFVSIYLPETKGKSYDEIMNSVK